VTGVSWFSAELGSKHLEVLNELVPQATLIAILLNPNNPEAAFYEQSLQEGVRAFGRRLLILKAASPRDIDAAFAAIAEQRANAVIVPADPFYPGRARQLAVLAGRHVLPMLSVVRDIPVAGGLVSYGNSVNDAYRRAGILAGRILKGAKPADTPVDRALGGGCVLGAGLVARVCAHVQRQFISVPDAPPVVDGRSCPRRPTPITTNPTFGREAALAGFAELVYQIRVRPLNNYLTLKVPFKGWLSSSMGHFWFRTHHQQPPRPTFLPVALRKEQCRLPPSPRRRLLP
jgi:ABC transporter substrate binding protein